MRKIIVAVLLVTMSVLATGCALAEPNYDRIPNQMQQNTIYHGGDNYSLIQCGSCGATYAYGRYERCPRCGNFFGGTTNESNPPQTNRVIHAPGPYYSYPGYFGQSDQRPFPNYYQGQNGNGTQMEQLLLEMLRKAVGK